MSVSYFGQHARTAGIAHWVDRGANGVSMIVDRIVKVGLVRTARDKSGRSAYW